MSLFALICVIVALVLFALAAFVQPVAIGQTGRAFNFVAAGLFFLTLASLLGGAGALAH